VTEASENPNVLVVLTDQQRWDTVGAYGSPMDLTPRLDAVAERGTVLERAFTPQPLCTPARACLQTGQYATTTDTWRLKTELGDPDVAMSHEFNNAEYDVGYVGKWHLAGGGTHGDNPIPAEKRAGYDDYFRGVELTAAASDEYGGYVYDGNGDRVEFDDYRVDAFTDFCQSFLRVDREDPFFLFLSLFEPHDQPRNDDYTEFDFAAPDGYAERYSNPHVPGDLEGMPGFWYESLPGYYGMCRRIDECFGRLVDELERQGIREETIILFTSDHGCHFGTRNAENKRSCHEASIRVPAILSGPGFDGGRRIRELTSLVDLPPTLLDAAGLPVPDAMEGESIRPLVDDDPATRTTARDEWRNEVFVQISEREVGRAIRTDRWKYSVFDPDGDPYEDARSDEYVERYLYDLRADPHERVNLVGRSDHEDVAADLRERLAAHIERVEDVDVDIEPAPYVA
jgi:arylsulfatase A-like enzyme